MTTNKMYKTSSRILSCLISSLFIVSCGGQVNDDLNSSDASSSVSSSQPSSSSISSSSSVSTTSSSLSSSSSSEAQTTLRIEEYEPALCSYSGAIDTKHNGFMGAGFIDTLNQTGKALVYAVKVEADTWARVSIRFGNGGDSPRGANVQTQSSSDPSVFSFVNTTAWDNWQTESQEIFLSQGNNLVTVYADTSNGLPNIDSVSFVARDVEAGECPAIATPGDIYPANGAQNVNPDTRLRINFSNTPSIGTGIVNIYDAANNSLVDSINIQNDSDTLGYPGQNSTRTLNVAPAQVIGNAISISPHTNKLEYGKSYYVVMGSQVLAGEFNGENFSGFNQGQWQFTTKANAPSGNTVSVDDDGPADFSSVQGALNYVMQVVGKNPAAVINIRNGIYPEPLYLRDKNNLRIVGESRDGTVIQYDNSDSRNSGSSGRPLFLVQSSDLLSLENLTVYNTHLRASGSGSQAETLYFNSDSGRLIAKNSAFISEQDTLLLKGYSWFYNSLVAGNVDFIWGYPKVALFENSEIRSLGDSEKAVNSSSGDDGSGGYLMQARVTDINSMGMIFLNSSLTRAPGPLGNTIDDGATYLARTGNSSSNPTAFYDNFAFINCRMDKHIAPVGWRNESNKPSIRPNPGAASYGFREYNTRDLNGNPLNLSSRIGVYLLSNSEYNQLYSSRALIFSGFSGGWNPQP